MIESPIERLAMTNPDLEIWWDSSPLVYPDWTRKMLENAEPDRREVLAEQLAKLFVDDDPACSLLRGCTTTPSPSYTAIQSHPHGKEISIGE